MTPPKIVVVGSSNTDMTVLGDRLPRPGETVTGGRFVQAGGGKGANQAVAVARGGGRVSFIGRVGRDAFGREACARLEAEGIDTRFVLSDDKAASGIALIMVDSTGENLISVAPGANARLTPDDVRAARPAIEQADALLVQLEIPMDAVHTALDLAAVGDTITIMDPAPVPDDPLPRAVLEKVSVLTPNRTEAAQLSGAAPEADVEQMARLLMGKGVDAVAVTLGADGVFLYNTDGAACLSPPPAHPVDTVGAGDCFAGILALALAETRTLAEAARMAVCAAAMATEKEGAQPAMPRRDGIECRLAEREGKNKS